MRTLPLAWSVAAVPLALALALALPACKRPEPGAQPVADAIAARPAPSVRFARVVTRKMTAALEASGTLAADETSEVAAPGAGVVTKVLVDVGSRVKKGDLLVQLDQREPAAKLAQANAQTQAAVAHLGLKPGERFDPKNVADVRAAKEAMDLAVTEAERAKNLFDTGGVAQAQWDQARTRAEQARAQYESALNGAQQAWASLALAQAQAGLNVKQLGDMAVRAPFDGAVAERRVTEGEYAPIGRVVAVVVRDRPLRLKVEVAEADSGRVTLGSDVSITVAAYAGRVFHGTIKRVGASIRMESRALPVEAEVPNLDGALKPGSFARAAIAVNGSDADARFVPRAAVGTSGSAARLFVRSGTRVVERIVTLGREVDGLVEVRGTLAPTDEVATEHVDELNDGSEIRPAP